MQTRSVFSRSSIAAPCRQGEQVRQFHNTPGVTVGELVKAGAKFSPDAGVWRFPDGSRGQFVWIKGMTNRFFQAVE